MKKREGVKKQNKSEDLPIALPFVAFGEKAKNRQIVYTFSILTVLPLLLMIVAFNA